MFGFSPGPAEMIVVMVIGVLLFGGKLPEIMRSLGRGVVEFRKGLHGVPDETGPPERSAAAYGDEPEAPKFQITDD